MTVRVPLLLHSLSDTREVWLPLLAAADVRSVIEIGAETGTTTRLLAGWLAARGGGSVTSVDPFAEVIDEHEVPVGVAVRQVHDYSPEALRGLPLADAYVEDGDHNWWTVTRELEAVEEAADGGPLPLVVFNDVSWPCARRDLYYDPARLPPEGVHPHSFEGGVMPGLSGTRAGRGFRGMGEFAVAEREGGPRNGVLTAVEDFLAARANLRLHLVPSVFGVGVVVDDRQPYAARVEELVAPYTDEFHQRLEANRVELYIAVLELQDRLAATERERTHALAQLELLHARARTDAAWRAALKPALDSVAAPEHHEHDEAGT